MQLVLNCEDSNVFVHSYEKKNWIEYTTDVRVYYYYLRSFLTLLRLWLLRPLRGFGFDGAVFVAWSAVAFRAGALSFDGDDFPLTAEPPAVVVTTKITPPPVAFIVAGVVIAGTVALFPLFGKLPLFIGSWPFWLIGLFIVTRFGFGSLIFKCSLKFKQKSPIFKISPFFPEYNVKHCRQIAA